MKTQSGLLDLLFLFVTFFFCLQPTPAVGFPDNTGENNGSDFIRSSCGATLYPELCYTSLAGYANAVQQDPTRLARVAIGVSLSRARQIASYVANISRQADYSAEPRAVAALHDCFSNLDDAVDEMRGSLKQMRQLVAAGSESFRFQMSNVQTWMSAALTDEETCTDGFQDVSDGPVKQKVCDGVAHVKKFTSNALALVNSCAEKGMR